MTVAAVLRHIGPHLVLRHPIRDRRGGRRDHLARRIGAVVVLDGGGRLVGIVSEHDVVRVLAREMQAHHIVCHTSCVTRGY
jgi:CBS domain-containing protein